MGGPVKRSYLVVANQTLGGEHLIASVRQCMAAGPCRFHLVVPATPPSQQATWTEGEAQGRLHRTRAAEREAASANQQSVELGKERIPGCQETWWGTTRG